MSQRRIIAPIAYCPNPACQAVLTGFLCAVAGDDHARPMAGDLTVCAYCGEPACYANDEGELRAITDEDWIGLDPAFRVSIIEASRFIKAHPHTPPARKQ